MSSYRYRYHLVSSAHWDRPLPDTVIDFEAPSNNAAIARVEEERAKNARKPAFEGITDELLTVAEREVALPHFSKTAA